MNKPLRVWAAPRRLRRQGDHQQGGRRVAVGLVGVDLWDRDRVSYRSHGVSMLGVASISESGRLVEPC